MQARRRPFTACTSPERATAARARAPTPSRCAPSTRPATPTRRRRRAPGPSTPPRRTRRSRPRPTTRRTSTTGELRVQARPRPARRSSASSTAAAFGCTSPHTLHGPRRRHPHASRCARPTWPATPSDAGQRHLDDRHRRRRRPIDRPRPGRPEQRHDRRLLVHLHATSRRRPSSASSTAAPSPPAPRRDLHRPRPTAPTRFEVRATDAAGNADRPRRRSPGRSTPTAPDTTIDSGPDDSRPPTTRRSGSPSNEAGATLRVQARRRRRSRPAPRRRPTRGLSRGQPTPSRSARPTRRATPTRRRTSARWTVDTVAPDDDDRPRGPTRPDRDTATLRVQLDRAGRDASSASSTPAPSTPAPRPSPTPACAEGSAHLPGARHRPGRQHRRRRGTRDLDRRHGRPDDDDRARARRLSSTSTSGGDRVQLARRARRTFECKLDGGTLARCDTAQVLTGLADGRAHLPRARRPTPRATSDQTPESRTWTVDTIAARHDDRRPARAGTVTTDGRHAHLHSSNETGDQFECQLDGRLGADLRPSPTRSPSLATAPTPSRCARPTPPATPTDARPRTTWTVDTDRARHDHRLAARRPLAASTTASVGFIVRRAGSTFECKLDAAPGDLRLARATYTGLAAGPAHPPRSARSTRPATPTPTPADAHLDRRHRRPGHDHRRRADRLYTAIDGRRSSLGSEARRRVRVLARRRRLATCSSPRALGPRAEGPTRFRVRAMDAAGNVDATRRSGPGPSTRAAADTTISAALRAPVSSSPRALASPPASRASSFECRLDDGPWAGLHLAARAHRLADGGHTSAVRGARHGRQRRTQPEAAAAGPSTPSPRHHDLITGPDRPDRLTSAALGFCSAGGVDSAIAARRRSWQTCTSPRALTGLGAGRPHLPRSRDRRRRERRTPPRPRARGPSTRRSPTRRSIAPRRPPCPSNRADFAFGSDGGPPASSASSTTGAGSPAVRPTSSAARQRRARVPGPGRRRGRATPTTRRPHIPGWWTPSRPARRSPPAPPGPSGERRDLHVRRGERGRDGLRVPPRRGAWALCGIPAQAQRPGSRPAHLPRASPGSLGNADVTEASRAWTVERTPPSRFRRPWTSRPPATPAGAVPRSDQPPLGPRPRHHGVRTLRRIGARSSDARAVVIRARTAGPHDRSLLGQAHHARTRRSRGVSPRAPARRAARRRTHSG